jgi:hypothetical protein
LFDLPDQAGTSDEAGFACWAHIENRLLTKRHKSGKSYKFYVCDYALKKPIDSQHKTFRRGFSDQAKNVVRSYLSEEKKGIRRDKSMALFSLNQPFGENAEQTAEDTLKESDLAIVSLLCSLTEPEINEFREIAEEVGAKIFSELKNRERYAIWAGINNLSLATPKLLEKAGCGKSQLYESRKSVEGSVASYLENHFPGEDDYSLYVLRAFVAEKLEREVFFWEKSENLDPLRFKEEQGA